MRNVCFLFSQTWFVMPNTSGGGPGVFGSGRKTWRLELSQQCRKIRTVGLQRAGEEDQQCGRGGKECQAAASAGLPGAGSGASGRDATHPALGAAAGAPAH